MLIGSIGMIVNVDLDVNCEIFLFFLELFAA